MYFPCFISTIKGRLVLSFLYDNLLTIMQLVVLFVSIYISFTPHIKRIFVADFIVNVSLLACYIILGDVTTAVMYVCISLRSFVYIYKDRLLRYGWIPWVAIVAQIALGFATIDNPFQIVSIFIPCWVCWYLWYWHDDKQKIRFGNIVNNGCWGIYNGIVGLWIVVLMRVIVVISNAVSIARTYREEKTRDRADSLQEAFHEPPEKETAVLSE